MKRLTSEEFIEKSNQIHNNKYDYSLVDYINNKIKVNIICKEHGIFEQKPYSHLQGKGCPYCKGGVQLTTDRFIEISNKIHKGKYDYSLSNYTKANSKVSIICKKHGIFEQRSMEHMNGIGCSKCSNKHKYTTEEIIKKFKIIHGDKYDYSLVNYVNNDTKVKIICKKHGEFDQSTYNHMYLKHGCPQCSESKGEKEIRNILENNNIKFVYQKRFKDCRYIKPLPFDFYIPDENICIEFDGKQHYESSSFFQKYETLSKRNELDNIKTIYCKDNNIKLIRISYKEIKNINNILINKLKIKQTCQNT